MVALRNAPLWQAREKRKERMRLMDGACLWPRWLEPAPPATDLADTFAALNEGAISRAIQAKGAGRRIISFSHYLAHPKLHRGPLLLGDIEGSKQLGEQVGARCEANMSV